MTDEAATSIVLEGRGIDVRYDQTVALRSVDMLVRRGETLALLGPSGSGKTTLLYAIAGFLPLSAGEITLDGRLVASTRLAIPPEQRPVAMVFQHYGLWPHLGALDTVAYPLRRAGVDATEARRRASELLEQMRIPQLARRRPAELSGGEQQRVGLARALARRPVIYLLDEPTAHLDTVLKADLQAELASRMHADGAAAIHATHDVEEALAVADRVMLLRDGGVVQVGRPEDIYARPVDDWAARLTGPASFVDGVSESVGSASVLVVAGVRCALSAAGAPSGGRGRFLVRPDWICFDGPLGAIVRDVRYRGTHTDYLVATDAGPLSIRELGAPRFGVEDRVSCRIERAWPMPG